MIIIFDDDATVYASTLMTYGTIWNWLSIVVPMEVLRVKLSRVDISRLGVSRMDISRMGVSRVPRTREG